MRMTIGEDPFVAESRPFWERGHWPAKWIGHPEVKGTEPAVTAYRRLFSLNTDSCITVHVSADERYELFLDGERIGRGSERGDRQNWYFETYRLELSAGPHSIVAKTWWLGPDAPAPWAQFSVKPAFLLAAEGEHASLLSTGISGWSVKQLGGYSCVPPGVWLGVGCKFKIDGSRYDWGFESGIGDGWVDAVSVGQAGDASIVNEFQPIWMLRPATLPPMFERLAQTGVARHVDMVAGDETASIAVSASNHIRSESTVWDRLLAGTASVSIPAQSRRRIIVDLGNYFCAYPELVTSGGAGATIRVLWAESLFEQIPNKECYSGIKGNRGEIQGSSSLG